jgi:hypothetical protein
LVKLVAAIHTKQYPGIAEFPHPVQNLLGVELSSVSGCIATGKQVPTYDNDRMCQFRRRYLLPCRYIFYLNIKQTVLTVEKWRGYLKLFDNNGMEAYETIGQVRVPPEDERGPSKVRVEKPVVYARNG